MGRRRGPLISPLPIAICHERRGARDLAPIEPRGSFRDSTLDPVDPRRAVRSFGSPTLDRRTRCLP
ncbi:MAG: hypothetical protein C0498_00745 [Anaerolinea sp.]|nr:hypothetical protein [Anaerolinea sp.]